MGLIDRFRGRIKIPAFSVGIFGKLPCHKEYFLASCHPVFGELKACLDQGFETMIRAGAERPYVSPDRCFFYGTKDAKVDLAGMIFESDDGLRGFPFMMAAPLPRKFRTRPFPEFWQCLERIWQYLSAYHKDLRAQPDGRHVYNRVRDVVHELDAFTPEPWEEETPLPLSGTILQDLRKGNARVSLHDLTERDERRLVRTLQPDSNPTLVLWPESGWRADSGENLVTGLLSHNGLDDVDFSLFPARSRHGGDEPLTQWKIPEATTEAKAEPEATAPAPEDILAEEPTLKLPREKPGPPPDDDEITLVRPRKSDEEPTDQDEIDTRALPADIIKEALEGEEPRSD
jgi:hypothetical protein